jgi:hypothetical protein
MLSRRGRIFASRPWRRRHDGRHLKDQRRENSNSNYTADGMPARPADPSDRTATMRRCAAIAGARFSHRTATIFTVIAHVAAVAGLATALLVRTAGVHHRKAAIAASLTTYATGRVSGDALSQGPAGEDSVILQGHRCEARRSERFRHRGGQGTAQETVCNESCERTHCDGLSILVRQKMKRRISVRKTSGEPMASLLWLTTELFRSTDAPSALYM